MGPRHRIHQVAVMPHVERLGVQEIDLQIHLAMLPDPIPGKSRAIVARASATGRSPASAAGLDQSPRQFPADDEKARASLYGPPSYFSEQAEEPADGGQLHPNPGDNYSIKTIDGLGGVQLSEVVRVQVADQTNTITVVNNPVRGGTIRLQFGNIQKGNYQVSLLNTSGAKVYTGTLSYGGGNTNEQIDLKQQVAAGIYRLTITNGTFFKVFSLLIQ